MGKIDLEAFRRDRDQLWAEAAASEAQGESILLDEGLWRAAAKEQAARELVNPFEDSLAEKIGDREGYLFISDAWLLLKLLPGRQTQHDNDCLGKAMKALGFRKVRRRLKGNKRTAYVRGHFEKGEARRLEICERFSGGHSLVSSNLEEDTEVEE